MAPPEGFEPPTNRVEICGSIQTELRGQMVPVAGANSFFLLHI